MKKQFTKLDPYKVVTDALLKALDNGTVPWRKPWNANTGAPANMVSKQAYKGSNVFITLCAGYSSRWWLSYKQAKTLGGNVKAGEKGTRIIKFSPIPEKRNAAGELTKKGGAYFSVAVVFNLEQCEGIADPTPDFIGPIKPNEIIEKAEKIAAGYIGAPVVTYGGNRACYAPGLDTISMPEMNSFNTAGEFYSTLFHEYSHSTGHAKRLNRPEITGAVSFGSGDYSREELVAEFGAAFLCADAGITDTLTNSAAYIAGWKKKLRDPANSRWALEASGKAGRAADYIRGNIKKS